MPKLFVPRDYAAVGVFIAPNCWWWTNAPENSSVDWTFVVASPDQVFMFKDAESGYLRSALSSRKSIHRFKNLLPLQVGYLLQKQSAIMPFRFGSRRKECRWARANFYPVCDTGNVLHHWELPITHLLTVSESQITVRERFGLVMATVRPY